MKVNTLNYFISIACILAFFSSAISNAQENNSLLAGILTKGPSSPVMSISIFPTAPSSQAGRDYNEPVGNSGAARNMWQKISPILPLAQLGIGGATEEAGKMMGEAISITIPQVGFGFKGELSGKYVCVQYKIQNHQCDNDTVFIEKYSTFILKGSYKSDEVAGKFTIVHPWRADSSFTIPVDEYIKKNRQDLRARASNFDMKLTDSLKKARDQYNNSKGSSSVGNVVAPPPVPDVVNAFLITTDQRNNVCFENLHNDKNQALKDKYIQGIKVFAKSANSALTVVDSCPLPELGHCDHANRIRQYFYEKATKGNGDLENSKKACKKKGGKWF